MMLILIGMDVGIGWSADANRTPVVVTEVIVFQPPRPSGVVHEGRCWTESIAVSRPGAWRCMEDNSISDPCFEVRGNLGEVVCDANPADGSAGFVMKLTESLPKPEGHPSPESPASPWIIELADGTLCQAATGTMAAIGDQAVRYPCAPPASEGTAAHQPAIEVGVLDNLKPGKIWIADEVWFTVEATANSGSPFKLVKRKAVSVRRVWE